MPLGRHSDHQRVTALRVANVPKAEFERQVESEQPADKTDDSPRSPFVAN
jgi:hypothetical protein